MSWTPELDARVLKLRHEAHKSFAQIGAAIGKTSRSVGSRYYRLIGKRFPSDVVRDGQHLGRLLEPVHTFVDLKPSKFPFAPDCSVPDFANDDEHCAAVSAAGGYPALNLRRRA